MPDVEMHKYISEICELEPRYWRYTVSAAVEASLYFHTKDTLRMTWHASSQDVII